MLVFGYKGRHLATKTFSSSCIFQPCDLVRPFTGPALSRSCIFSRPQCTLCMAVLSRFSATIIICPQSQCQPVIVNFEPVGRKSRTREQESPCSPTNTILRVSVVMRKDTPISSVCRSLSPCRGYDIKWKCNSAIVHVAYRGQSLGLSSNAQHKATLTTRSPQSRHWPRPVGQYHQSMPTSALALNQATSLVYKTLCGEERRRERVELARSDCVIIWTRTTDNTQQNITVRALLPAPGDTAIRRTQHGTLSLLHTGSQKGKMQQRNKHRCYITLQIKKT